MLYIYWYIRYFLLVFWHNSHDISPQILITFMQNKKKERKLILIHPKNKQNKKHNLNVISDNIWGEM